MTTDLSGDFGLGEEEFDWDVFVPDPDEAEIERKPPRSRTRTSWTWTTPSSIGTPRSATTPDRKMERTAEHRAGAAYDRIVDTVRRSFEDEPSTEADSRHEADTLPAFGAVDEPELVPKPSGSQS